MGNKQVGQAPFHLEFLQQVQHLGADGDVQRRDGLVRHDELRLHDDAAGDADALALAAGELMGVPGQVLGQQAHVTDDLLDLGNAVFLILVQVEVVKSLGDDVFDGGALVQAGGGVLEDHLDLPDDLPVIFTGELAGDLLSLVIDGARGAGVDADDGATDGGLSGAGLAHEGEGLALINVEADVFDGLERFFSASKDDVQILDRQHDFSVILCHMLPPYASYST